jgi:hypothetical protein
MGTSTSLPPNARLAVPRRRSSPASNTAFLNVPYDKKFEPLFLAYLSGLCGFGLVPRATLEIPGGARRLDRIFQLIRGCRYSFHDLSRVELDEKPPRTPRFNMPFELGLVVAWTKTNRTRHDWFVFESRNRRLGKSLSDLNGTDAYIHLGNPRGILRSLTNALVRNKRQPTLTQLEQILSDVKKASTIIKCDLRTTTLFEARPFRELVVAAIRSANNRIR